MSDNRKIMIVAGEASGDTHAAKLVSALNDLKGDGVFEYFGSAGEKMRAAGVRPVVKADELSIVGLLEIGGALPMFFRAFSALRNAAKTEKPDVAILVDFPDFNLRLARTLNKMGIPVVYYISPQLWAWRKYRISVIKKYVDLLIAILPFEKQWYANHGVDHVEYVGNPLAREVNSTVERPAFCAANALDASRPIVALLPGSRHKEIVRILPVMLLAAIEIAEHDSTTQFLIAAADARGKAEIDKIIKEFQLESVPGNITFKVIENDTYNALNASDAAAVASGTATLETGIIGTPMVIVYKTSSINYKLLEPLISVDHYGLINLIAEERVAKELIQDDFSPRTMADEIIRLLDTKVNKAMREKLKQTTDKLGKGGASKRAAEAVMRLIS